MPMGDLAAQDDYTTPLSADDIPDFVKWKQQYAPRDSGFDYDLPGAYKAGLTPDTATGHFDDQFKKPNHPTFSTFSQYAKERPDLAGTWQGDQYIPPPARSNLSPDETLMQPPKAALDLPPEAYASLGGGDLGLLGNKGIAGLFGGQSWLQKAQDLGAKDIATYQNGGLPAVMGSLAADTSDAQDLASGFGGNIKGVKPPVVPGALAALGEYHPPFYSAVERAVQDAKQNTAPGQQWAGYLRNQPGVKPEEVETLGLGKLFEQPTVSKDALLGEIAANKVNVGEVRKGGIDRDAIANAEAERAVVRAELNAARGEIRGAADRDAAVARVRDLADRDQALTQQIINANEAPTKFSQYTLPGGENYREMLLTLPHEKNFQWKPNEFGDVVSQDGRYTIRQEQLNGQPQFITYGNNNRRLSAHDTLEAAQNLVETSATNAPNSNLFRSSHFDEPNVLAHVRYNDRVIDGKKTLFVEEVQSDWHQKGKREGYRQEPSADEKELLQLRGKYDPTNQAALSTAEHARMAELENRVGYGLANKVRESAVPDAPFKTTWPDLAMKRIIREAAEKGYDKVAWTPGSVQADRYDLSKQIDRVLYRPESKELLAWRKGAGEDVDPTIHERNVTPEKIPDIIGKEGADRLFAQPVDRSGAHILKGADLKVGGEGMKGFYDEILPATVNKLTKKYGGRVGQSEMVTFPGDAGSIVTMPVPKETAKVHTLDITPSLRAAAMKGFPLFTAGGIITAGGIKATGMMGDLAKQDDYQ